MSLTIGNKCLRFTKLLKKPVRRLSVSCPVNQHARAFVTPEQNPANHTRRDVGLFYCIPNQVSLETLFKKALFPDYKEECQTFNETPILIREPALEIIHCLKNADYSSPINKYLIYGPYGSGKTMTLCHALHYAYLDNWLIFHVPNVLNWIYTMREKCPSPTKENFTDLPTVGSSMLMTMRQQTEHIIKKFDLRLQNDYRWNIKEANSKGESLLNLINHGITRAKYSCDVICAVCHEFKELAKSGKVKVLVAIDGYNLIFQSRTKIKDASRKFITPMQISCFEAIRDMAKSDWHNGAAILTCSMLKDPEDLDNYLPMRALGRPGFEFLDPFVPVEIPRLTEKEMTSVLTYYRSKNWLTQEGGDEELKFLCNGNAMYLKQICSPL